MTNFHYAPIESGLATSSLSDFQDKAAGKVRADFGFQSRVRWSLENKQSYMTSLILGMAPSKFIFASTKLCANTNNIPDKEYYDKWNEDGVDYLNIDSNNRVTTIAEYWKNEFGIEEGFYAIDDTIVQIIKGTNDTYDSLPLVVKEKLNTATITLEIIHSASRNQLSQLFIRLNDGMSLNGPEKRNAIISKFADEIRRLATKHETHLSDFFAPKDINRRKVDDFIAGLAMIYFHGIKVTISEKTFQAAYKSESTEDNSVDKFVTFIEKFFKFIGNKIKTIPNKNTVLDLFVIYKQLTDDRFVIEDKKKFFKDFFKVNADLLKDTTKHEYNDGRDATYKELLRSREVRFNTLRHKLILDAGFNPESYAIERDSRRTFTREDKFISAVESDFMTAEGKEIDPTKLYDFREYQGGHIQPWSKGGKTNQDNCVIQTAEDNNKLGAKPVE